MILLGLFKFVTFTSGILLTLIVGGLLLRARKPEEGVREVAASRENRQLQIENDRLKRQSEKLESELRQQQADLQEMRRELQAIKAQGVRK